MNFLIEFLRFLATFSVAFALGYFVAPRLVTRYLEYKEQKDIRKFHVESLALNRKHFGGFSFALNCRCHDPSVFDEKVTPNTPPKDTGSIVKKGL